MILYLTKLVTGCGMNSDVEDRLPSPLLVSKDEISTIEYIGDWYSRHGFSEPNIYPKSKVTLKNGKTFNVKETVEEIQNMIGRWG